MLESGKLWVIVIGLTFLGPSLFAGEPVEEELLNAKKTAVIESAHVKVTNQYGKVIFTDFKTPTDDHIDFDLQPLPVGNYSVEVHRGGEMINSTEVRNVSSSKNVLTVEILNAKGNQVYESVNPSDSFDLSTMGRGIYTVNVYQGSTLLNTRKIKN